MELSLDKAALVSPSIRQDFSAQAGDGTSRRLRGRAGLVIATMAVLFALGIFLRVHVSAGYNRLGYDEHGYMVFLHQIEKVGLINYDAVVQSYVEDQYKRPDAIVPATRIGFLVPAHLCQQVFGCGPFAALRMVSCIASILMLGLCAIFAYRLGGSAAMMGVTALIATAPLQIYLSQRALIDGYFAFLAVLSLWLAWENLQRPRHLGWLTAYAASLALLVLTKENAAFVVFAIFGVLLLNGFLHMGTVTPHLLAATIIGPALAVLFLALLVGGVGEWIRFYQNFVAKSRTNPYSILAQDGPWYRYLIDFIIISPLPVLFACGRIFRLRTTNRPELFMSIFLGLSFLCMASVTYGMSLRYAAYWDIPLAWLASSQILVLSRQFDRIRPVLLATGLFLVLAASGLSQYHRFFVRGAIYDPTTAAMARAADLEKR